MTTLKRTVISALTSCALVLSGAGVAYGSTVTVTMQDRDSVSVTVESTTFERESEPESPRRVGVAVTVVFAVLAGGYKWAYNDGVARAATGQVTWSMWEGQWGWALLAYANGLGPVGWAGYQGWSHGFKTECPKH